MNIILKTIVSITILLAACHTNDNLLFKDRINIINKTEAADVYYGDLLEVEEFMEIYKSPSRYYDSAIVYMSEIHNDTEKAIVIFSMHNLNLKKYVLFLEQCYKLYEQGQVSEELLRKIIVSEFDSYQFKIIRNYDNEDVRSVLKRINNNKRISTELKEDIHNILNGNTWEQVKPNASHWLIQ